MFIKVRLSRKGRALMVASLRGMCSRRGAGIIAFNCAVIPVRLLIDDAGSHH